MPLGVDDVLFEQFLVQNISFLHLMDVALVKKDLVEGIVPFFYRLIVIVDLGLG